MSALDAIVSELSDADRQERIELLIDFAKNLPPLPERLADAQGRDPPGRGMPVAGLPLRRAGGRPRRALRRCPDRGPHGPRVRLPAARGLQRRDGRGGAPGPRRPGRAARPARDPGDAPRPGPDRSPPSAQGRGHPRGDRAGRDAARDRRSAAPHRPTREEHRTMADFVKVTTRDELPPGARTSPKSTAGRSPSSTSTARSTRSTTSAPTTAARSPRASSRAAEIRCPRHGARFDVRTGKALCMPAVEPVTTHAVEVRGDDIYVALTTADRT